MTHNAALFYSRAVTERAPVHCHVATTPRGTPPRSGVAGGPTRAARHSRFGLGVMADVRPTLNRDAVMQSHDGARARRRFPVAAAESRDPRSQARHACGAGRAGARARSTADGRALSMSDGRAFARDGERQGGGRGARRASKATCSNGASSVFFLSRASHRSSRPVQRPRARWLRVCAADARSDGDGGAVCGARQRS